MWVPSLGLEDLLEEGMQPTPVFLPVEPIDRGAWGASVHRVAQRPTRLKQLSKQLSTDVFGFINNK